MKSLRVLSIYLFLAAVVGTAQASFPVLKLELLAEGQFGAPTSVTNAGDGSDRLFITDQRGQIYIFADGYILPQPFLDLSSKLVTERPGFDERGLLGLAFHPDYATAGAAGEGLFYVYYSAPSPHAPGTSSNPVDHMSVVAEYRVSTDPDVADPLSERILLTIDQPQFNHNAGQLAFGPDGFLYIATGDGGSSNDNNAGHTGGSATRPTSGLGNAQDRTNLLGKILRIAPQGSNGPGGAYGIPATNPFVGEGGGVREEIYAYGLRNPWRFSFDDGPGGTGRLFCADLGQGEVEEVNLIVSGGNYGWRKQEGTFVPDFSVDAPALTGNVVDPIAQYAHPDVIKGSPALPQIGISVTGGYVYRGSAIPALQGIYVFGDWSTSFGTPNGTLLGLEETSPGTFAMSVLTVEGGNPIGLFIPSFGEDEDGELYVATKTTLAPSTPDPDTGLPAGQLYRLTAGSTTNTVTLAANADNTIFSDFSTNSNGSGVWLFAGQTANGGLRRALLSFDLSGIPDGSQVNSATVSLTMDKTIVGAHDVTLHRVSTAWGESGSNAPGNEGAGVSAQAGDATWSTAIHPGTPWNSSGGDFVGTASASTSVGGNGRYQWTSPTLTADVQAWLDGTPNHGWLLLGNETTTSAKRFASRENATLANRPSLEVTYTSAASESRRRTWEQLYFPAGQFLAPGGDSDADDIPLLLEYAWDLNPHARQQAYDYFSIGLNGGAGTRIEFLRDPRAVDLNYHLQTSTNLKSWTTVLSSIAGSAPTGTLFDSEAPDAAKPELRRVVAIDPSALSTPGRSFRLLVERP